MIRILRCLSDSICVDDFKGWTIMKLDLETEVVEIKLIMMKKIDFIPLGM